MLSGCLYPSIMTTYMGLSGDGRNLMACRYVFLAVANWVLFCLFYCPDEYYIEVDKSYGASGMNDGFINAQSW